MKINNVALLIDGENFRKKIEVSLADLKKVSKYDVDLNFLDFDRLFNEVLKDYQINIKRFYSAKLHPSKNPLLLNKSYKLIRRQRNLQTKLSKLGYEFITAGHVRENIGTNNHSDFKEKGVDVKIAVDLVTMACDKTINTAILCSSDSDLQPAVKEAKNRGIDIIYLGFEINPNIGLTKTTTRTVLFRNVEIQESYYEGGHSAM